MTFGPGTSCDFVLAADPYASACFACSLVLERGKNEPHSGPSLWPPTCSLLWPHGRPKVSHDSRCGYMHNWGTHGEEIGGTQIADWRKLRPTALKSWRTPGAITFRRVNRMGVMICRASEQLTCFKMTSPVLLRLAEVGKNAHLDFFSGFQTSPLDGYGYPMAACWTLAQVCFHYKPTRGLSHLTPQKYQPNLSNHTWSTSPKIDAWPMPGCSFARICGDIKQPAMLTRSLAESLIPSKAGAEWSSLCNRT